MGRASKTALRSSLAAGGRWEGSRVANERCRTAPCILRRDLPKTIGPVTWHAPNRLVDTNQPGFLGLRLHVLFDRQRATIVTLTPDIGFAKCTLCCSRATPERRPPLSINAPKSARDRGSVSHVPVRRLKTGEVGEQVLRGRSKRFSVCKSGLEGFVGYLILDAVE